MISRLKNHFCLPAVVLAIAAVLSCQKEPVADGEPERLSFSADTVVFDTVFTTIGSTTRHFKVYNPGNRDITIRSVTLGGGGGSSFRINVDGLQGPRVDNYLLRARDSMFVFVEVAIDPLGEDLPLLVQDSIVFITNGSVQDVDLVAWGQDVHFFNGEIIQGQTWTNDKPYLIYNSMLLDTGQVLVIEEGVRLHFHRFSTFYVAGTLLVRGSLEQPVVFQGDRLEMVYSDVPGQWGGIYFLNGSSGHEMENVVVKNAGSGIHLGNLFTPDPPPDLSLKNARVEHMSYTGLSSIGGTISAANLLVSNCGFYNILITAGGNVEFIHCTLANYWSYSNRITPAVALTNYFKLSDDIIVTGDLTNAYFGNCIIYGRRDSEIVLSQLQGSNAFQYYFDHCLLKVDTSVHVNDPLYFNQIYSNIPPGFVNEFTFDYSLDTLAFAQDKGDPAIALAVPTDLAGNSRLTDAAPDLGAIERIENP